MINFGAFQRTKLQNIDCNNVLYRVYLFTFISSAGYIPLELEFFEYSSHAILSPENENRLKYKWFSEIISPHCVQAAVIYVNSNRT